MAQFVLTAQVALQAPGNTKQVINQIRQQLQGINVNINLKANTSQLNNVNTQLTQTSKTAKVAERSISELGRSLGSAARRFGVIAIATGTFINLSRAIKSSLGDAIEFERQLVNLSQVTGKSVRNLQEITGEITRLSTGLGVSSDQLLKTSIILAQAGLEARKVKSALEVLAKTELASSFDNITNTTEGAIAILSQFRREAAAAGGDVIYLEQALGAINDVSKKFAVESADLVAVIRRSGGAFEAAGGSLNELLALFTSVRATTRESAETIATGLRTIFTRIQRVDTIAQLQQLGIVLQDVEGKFVGPFEAIKRISEGLASLDPRDFRFSAIVEELGGYRQIGKVIPLIKQFTLAQDALNTAQGASGSLTKDAETAQLSLANQLAKVREEFQALIRQFVDSSTFRDVAGGALEFARALIRIADALEPVLPLLAGLTAFQIGKGFIPAVSGLIGLNRKNAGGRIHKFASGGFVPGSGNRDTVPAMLTPGEFVIRKSSANKIGAENLQKLNRGGVVQKFADGGKIWEPSSKIAAVTLEDRELKSITTTLGEDDYDPSILGIAKSNNVNLLRDYNIDKFSINSEKLKGLTGERLKENLLAGAKVAMEQTAGLIRDAGIAVASPLLTPEAEQKFAKSIGTGPIGSLFEATISAIKDPTFSDAEDQGRPFDFIGGLGNAGSIFKGKGDINSYKYIDAKATADAASTKSFKTKIKKQSQLELLGAANPQGTEAKTGLKQILDEYVNEVGKPLSKGKIEKFIENQGSPVPRDNKKIEEWFNSRGINGRFESIVPTKENQRSNFDFVYKNFGGKIQKFAKGGAASDNVPALLTPGEFVVNRKTAQDVGYGNLNRMNKTGKIPGFAKGGIVGPKRFQAGGPVNPNIKTGSNTGPELKVLADVFNRLAQQSGGVVTSFNLLEAALKEVQDSGVRFSKSQEQIIKKTAQDAKNRAAIEKTQIDSYRQNQKAQEEAKQKTEDFKSSITSAIGSIQQFAVLGASAIALTSQFSSLDRATADALTETAGWATGIISGIAEFTSFIVSTGYADTALKYFTASVSRAAAASTASSATSAAGSAGAGAAASGGGLLARLIPLITNPLGAAIAVVVVALGAFAAYIYFIQARAKKVAEGLRKSADDIAASIEQGKGGNIQEYVSLQVNAAKTITDSYLTLGGMLDSFGITSAKARQEEIDAIQRAASAYIGTIETIAKADKELAAIDLDKSLTPAESAFKKIAAIAQEGASVRANLAQTSPAAEMQKLAEREGVFKPVSQLTEADFSNENAKAAFQLLQKNLVSTFENLEKRSVELQSLAQAQLEAALQATDFSQVATQDFNLDGVIDSFDTILSQNQNFATGFQQAVNEIIANGLTLANELRKQGKFVQAAELEQQTKKQAQLLQESAVKQANAFKKSQEGALAFQKALEANLVQFRALRSTTQFIESLNGKIKDLGDRMSDLNSIMSGELMSFEIPEIQGLSDLSDIKDFNKFKTEVGKLGASMGANGQMLANQLVDSAALMENAKKELTGINFAQIGAEGENAAKTAFEKAFGQSGQLLKNIFGEQIGGQLGITIQKQLEDSIRTASERGGMVDPSELEKILDPLQEVIEENRVLFESLNNIQREYVNQYNSTNKMLFEVMKRDIDGRQKLVDIQNRSLNRLDQATNKSVNFQEKEARRNRSRGARLGAVGLGGLSGDIRGMGSALSTVNKRLEANAEIIRKDDRAKSSEAFRKAQTGLTLQANELKRSLEELADQSDKASDVMSEIEKERGKREAALKIVEDFVVGGEEQRTGIAKQFAGLQAAMMAGSLQVLPEEERKASFGLLDQLAAIDDRFKAIKESLVISDAVRMGLDPQTAMALATATPKEQQLLEELQRITQQEIAAQQELNRINAEFGDKLSTELANLSTEINNLGQKIETTFAQKTTEAAATKGKEDIAAQEKKIEAGEKAKASAKVQETEKKLKQVQENRSTAAQTNIELGKELNAKQKEVEKASKMDENKTFGDAFQNVVSLGGALFTTSQQERFNQASAAATQTANELANRNQQVAAMDAEIVKLQQELAQAKQEQQQVENKYGQNVITKAKGGFVYRATGGSIFKPKGTDTIPAMLTPGEFVMRKSAVDKYGTDTMEAMNSGTLYAKDGAMVPEYEKTSDGKIIMSGRKPKVKELSSQEWDFAVNENVIRVTESLRQKFEQTEYPIRQNFQKIYAEEGVFNKLRQTIKPYTSRNNGKVDQNVLDRIAEESFYLLDFPARDRANAEKYSRNKKLSEKRASVTQAVMADVAKFNQESTSQADKRRKEEQALLEKEQQQSVMMDARQKLGGEVSTYLSGIGKALVKLEGVDTVKDREGKAKQYVKLKPLAGQIASDKSEISTATLRIPAEAIDAELKQLLIESGDLNPAYVGGAGGIDADFNDSERNYTVSKIAKLAGENYPTASLATYSNKELVNLLQELESKKNMASAQANLAANRSAIEAASQNIAAFEKYKDIIISTGRYSDLMKDPEGNPIADLDLQNPKIFGRIYADFMRAYRILKSEADYDIIKMSKITPKDVFNKFTDSTLDIQKIRTPQQVAKDKLNAQLLEKNTAEFESQLAKDTAAAAKTTVPPAGEALAPPTPTPPETPVADPNMPLAATPAASEAQPIAAPKSSARQQREQAARQRVMGSLYGTGISARQQQRQNAVQERIMQSLYGPQLEQQNQMANMVQMYKDQADRQKAWNQIYQKYNNTALWLGKAGNDQQQASILRDAWYNSLKQFKDEPATYSDPRFIEALYRAQGGSIFKPRGTDTVPAMLTPGEFVIQRSAVQKYGVDTMQAINNGSAPAGLSQGGVVYRQKGGPIYRFNGGMTPSPQDGNMVQFDFTPIIQLQKTFDNLAQVLNNMQMTHQVNVDGALNINGVNSVEIANTIKETLAVFIVSEVTRIINSQGFKVG